MIPSVGWGLEEGQSFRNDGENVKQSSRFGNQHERFLLTKRRIDIGLRSPAPGSMLSGTEMGMLKG